MKNTLVVVVLAAAVLAACGAATRGKDAQPQMQNGGETFGFMSEKNSSGSRAGDPVAEMARIKELERRLQTNRMCLKGYEITSRRAIIQIGETDQVYYRGRCLT